MIEGSGSESVHLSNGSGSRRPKNMIYNNAFLGTIFAKLGACISGIYYNYKSETAITFYLVFSVNEQNYLSLL
jgi:hypothetical protein